MLSNLQKANLRSFTILLEQPYNLDEMRKINNEWVEAIINHYTNTIPLKTMYDLPFFHKGYITLLMKLMRRELFGSMRDIYETLVPKLDKPLTYPLFYCPIKLDKFRIYKLVKNNLPKLRDDFDKVLQGFNADTIYVLDVDEKYYIFDYEFKQSVICTSLKFEYINRFCSRNGLDKLDGYILLGDLSERLDGFVWLRDEDENKFINKYMIK